jgi:hypothetical protein
MTIGIAAYGPNAGLAVFHALEVVERFASGAIGGFAAFAAIGSDGVLYRAETQRGGTRTLFVEGETTGLPPTGVIAEANAAALMSSGPDRPAPLSDYVPGDVRAGLVTGHRLPNAAGFGGCAVNLEVLDRLRAGHDARSAVDDVLDADPACDAGLIAVDLSGGVYGRNSARVDRRPDLGRARCEDRESGAVIVVLHNAITPIASALVAAQIGLAVMVPPPIADGFVRLRSGVPVTGGTGNRVHVDAEGNATRIETTDARVVNGRHNCAVIYLGAEVVCGGVVLGLTLFEPNCVVEDGRIVSLNGSANMRIGFHRGHG